MNRSTALLGSLVLTIGLIGAASAATTPPVTAAQISAATTAADHETIAKAFDDQAADLTAKAEWHQSMAIAYRTAGKPAVVLQSRHCDALTKDLKAAAAESRALAAEHHKLAAAAKSQPSPAKP